MTKIQKLTDKVEKLQSFKTKTILWLTVLVMMVLVTSYINGIHRTQIDTLTQQNIQLQNDISEIENMFEKSCLEYKTYTKTSFEKDGVVITFQTDAESFGVVELVGENPLSVTEYTVCTEWEYGFKTEE